MNEKRQEAECSSLDLNTGDKDIHCGKDETQGIRIFAVGRFKHRG